MTCEPAFLLGAGASAEAGLPMGPDLTEQVQEDLRKSPAIDAEALTFELVARRLALFKLKNPRQFPGESLYDFERVLSALSLLSSGHEATIAALTSGWRDALPDPILRDRSRASLFQTARGCVAFTSLPRILSVREPAKVEYLRPLFEWSKTRRRTLIVTANYDNALEIAADSCSVTADTRVEEWRSHRRVSVPQEGLALLKLHGSITWRYIHSKLGRFTQDICERRTSPFPLESSPSQNGGNPSATACSHSHLERALIYDPVAKVAGRGPFIQLLAAFQTALRGGADTLVAIGYSFRDPHINATLEDWGGRVIVVRGRDYSESGDPWVSDLKDRMASFCNTHKKASEWLRDDLPQLCQ